MSRIPGSYSLEERAKREGLLFIAASVSLVEQMESTGWSKPVQLRFDRTKSGHPMLVDLELREVTVSGRPSRWQRARRWLRG